MQTSQIRIHRLRYSGATDEVSATPSVSSLEPNLGRAEVRRKLNSQPADVEAMQYPGEHARCHASTTQRPRIRLLTMEENA